MGKRKRAEARLTSGCPQTPAPPRQAGQAQAGKGEGQGCGFGHGTGWNRCNVAVAHRPGVSRPSALGHVSLVAIAIAEDPRPVGQERKLSTRPVEGGLDVMYEADISLASRGAVSKQAPARLRTSPAG